MPVNSIAVTASSPLCRQTAIQLAHQLQLTFIDNSANEYDYLLQVTPDYLGLINRHEKKPVPFYIDFSAKQLRYRTKQAGLRNEALARAIGLKPLDHPRIVDATAGLGRDSFILASLGYTVTLLEKSPVVHALLADAFSRAAAQPDLADTIKRMTLIQTRAEDWLAKQRGAPPDVIYLDPMFPVRRKSALVKKGMALLQALLPPEECDELFEQALACATRRVVVKRPRLAALLADKPPTFSIMGKTSRFDIYVV